MLIWWVQCIGSAVLVVRGAIRGREKNKWEKWEENPQEEGTKAICPTICEETRIS